MNTGLSMAQDHPHIIKLSPSLQNDFRNETVKSIDRYQISFAGRVAPDFLRNKIAGARVLRSNDAFTIIESELTKKDLRKLIDSSGGLLFVERANRQPRTELQVKNLDLSVNKINLAHRYFPGLRGDGRVVSIKEEWMDTSDIDLKGRYLPGDLNSDIISSHATIMGTMISGAGNSWYQGKGVAKGSRFSSSDFSNLLPDPDSYYTDYRVAVQNHSYGVGVESYYGADAMAYDQAAIQHPDLVLVFSSGNEGDQAPGEGTYQGMTGWANLTGSFKMAKNILTVGATDSFGVVSPLSSKGPAYDGRVKPEMVAFGEDGSSGAAALVSGTTILLQQAFREKYNEEPANALLKAVLINSADDRGNREVDYSNGFGSLNAFKAIRTIMNNQFYSATLNEDQDMIFDITIPSGINLLKMTLSWNDPPNLPNNEHALVNDLDLELKQVSSGNTWEPWILDPDPDSLSRPARRGKDTLNNLEQVTLDNPEPGLYEIHVKGSRVSGTQDFFVSYLIDSSQSFNWVFPTSEDYVLSGSSIPLRWMSNGFNEAASLDFSTDEGIQWQTISDSIDLENEFYSFHVPDSGHSLLFRMRIGSFSFLTDSLSISTRPDLSVGFNCMDSVQLYWPGFDGAEGYKVLALGSQDLEPLLNTTDSFIVLNKKDYPSLHYAVTPIFNGKEGVRSYTINYTLQGVECYFRSFLATQVGDSAWLQVNLGTDYSLDKISFEKFDGNQFQVIQTISNPSLLQYEIFDSHLTKGLNLYRVTLSLKNGSQLYSDIETVYYFPKTGYIIFPNPAVPGQPLNILTEDPGENVILNVFDSRGVLVFKTQLINSHETLPSLTWSKGIYFLQFLKDGKMEQLSKLILQ